VLDVDAQDLFEVATPEDQQVVETLRSDGADEALGVGVRLRRAAGEAEVARLLGDPGTGRVGGAASQVDAAAATFDEEEDVEATQRDRLDGEKSQASMLAAC